MKSQTLSPACWRTLSESGTREGADKADEFTKGFETAYELDNAKNELARVSAYRGTGSRAIDIQRKQIATAQTEVNRLTEALKPPKPPTPEAAQDAPVVLKHCKRWTPENLDKLKVYREDHTMLKTANEFGITTHELRAGQATLQPGIHDPCTALQAVAVATRVVLPVTMTTS